MDKKRKILIAVLSSLALILAVSAGTMAYLIFSVAPVAESFTYELGEAVGKYKSDYFSGQEWAVDLWELDFSGVDETKAGFYVVTASRWNSTVLFDVIIEDTISPKISVKSDALYFEVGDTVVVEDVVEGFFDKDTEAGISFLYSGKKEDTFSSDATGEILLTVCAWDTSGNQSEVQVPVIFDTAPVFAGIQEIYLACGYEVDYLERITATDEVDGDVSSAITVLTDEVNSEAAGDYSITYSVSDSYGLSEEQSTTVHVMEQTALQTAINTHEIQRGENIIVGALNLYDGGYYEEDNVEFIIEQMTPALVQIRYDGANGYYSHGSGFIISMNEEEIILCTNHHVVDARNKWDVYFFDGTKVTGTVIGTNKGDDIGFVRVAAADVPADTFAQLFTIHINKGYWDGLGDKEPISVCLRCINNEGGIWRDRTGIMKQKKLTPGTMPEIPHTDNALWVTINQFHGASGSAILDGHGNLVGMSYCIVWYYDKGTYQLAVNLQDILDAYEEIVGTKVYYE